MKDWLMKAFNFLDNLTYKINSVILIIVMILGYFSGRILGSDFGIGLGLALVIMFSTCFIITVIKHKRNGQAKVVFFGMILGLLIFLLNYFEAKNLNEYLLMPFIPLILIFFLNSIYKFVLTTEDRDIIRNARLGMMICMPALAIMFIAMVYVVIFVL